MDFRRIEQFVAVAHHGSFGKAAQALLMSQPALTRGIQSLEEEVGALLFQRGPKGAKMTQAGSKFLPRAQSMLFDFKRALQELEPCRALETNHLRIGVSPNFLYDIFPEMIVDILDKNPRMNIQLSTATDELLRERLRIYEIDIAIRITPDYAAARSVELGELKTIVVGHESMAPYVIATDPLAYANVTLEQLSYRRWAVPYEMSVSYRFESAFERQQIAPPIQNLNSPSLSLVRDFALKAGLIAMLPVQFAKPDVDARRLAPIHCPALNFAYSIALSTRQNDQNLLQFGIVDDLVNVFEDYAIQSDLVLNEPAIGADR